MKKAGGIFHSQKLGPAFASTSTTSSPMGKWMLQPDSAHQTGLKPTLHTVLIIVKVVIEEDEKAARVFRSQKLRPILLVPQQPVVPWTHGCYRQIRRIKLV